jgi:hypothetical protein
MTADIIVMQVINAILLGLTPVERWQAARRLDRSFMSDYAFILVTAIVLVALVVVLLWVSYSQISHRRKIEERLFIENAARRGLTSLEQDILRQVISHSGPERGVSIFTIQDAFERGATKLMQASATKYTPEQSEQLRAGLSFLREKLGFRSSVSSVSASKVKDVSTRQISVGKELQIERRKVHGSESIEAVVAENNEMEIAIKLATPLQTQRGDVWRVYYHFGTYVWEFDTSVIRCDGDILFLNHTEDVRSINRRRFVRVSTCKPALVASFPFFKTVKSSTDGADARTGKKRHSKNTLKSSWAVPKFVSAVVKELAGPGLLIEAPLQVRAGDRLLIVFKLDGSDKKSSASTSKTETSTIVGDIAHVRRCSALEKDFLIAVELIGLSDSDIDQLMQVAKPKDSKSASSSDGLDEQNAFIQLDRETDEQDVVKPKVMQGV